MSIKVTRKEIQQLDHALWDKMAQLTLPALQELFGGCTGNIEKDRAFAYAMFVHERRRGQLCTSEIEGKIEQAKYRASQNLEQSEQS